MKDDFFNKYLTSDNKPRNQMSDNVSSFVISENETHNGISSYFDFKDSKNSKTNLGL